MPMTLPFKASYRLGVISDTHGYLPDSALEAFRSVDAILHAGDIGSVDILMALANVAPVLAVRGNMDVGTWAEALPEKEFLQAGTRLVYLIHDGMKLRIDAPDSICLAVINGHTHQPAVETKRGVLYVNPGSAGAPRYGQSPGIAMLRVSEAGASADLISLTR